MTSIFEGQPAPKQGRTSKQNKGPHLGSRQLHSLHMNVQRSLILQRLASEAPYLKTSGTVDVF